MTDTPYLWDFMQGLPIARPDPPRDNPPARRLIVVDGHGGVHDCGTLTAVSAPAVAPDGTVSYTLTAQLHPDPDTGAYRWPYVG